MATLAELKEKFGLERDALRKQKRLMIAQLPTGARKARAAIKAWFNGVQEIENRRYDIQRLGLMVQGAELMGDDKGLADVHRALIVKLEDDLPKHEAALPALVAARDAAIASAAADVLAMRATAVSVEAGE